MTETNESLWRAPFAAEPLDATVTIPGSKSLSNRYLVLAAMGTKPVTLIGLLRSRDTELMMGALEALGVSCVADADDETTVVVTPPENGVFRGGSSVFCGLAGTVMRFVPALALYADGPVHFDGDKQSYQRPMGPLLEGLRQLGARIDFEGEPGHLPFTLTPPEQAVGGSVSIDSSGSSQFISGLLLGAPKLGGGLRLTHTGEHLPSLPHIRMTMADLGAAGVDVRMDGRTWTVAHGDVQLLPQVVVEPDLSNAAPFLGAALIAGGTVRVPNWPERTTQPGGLLPEYLEHMGATITIEEMPNGARTLGVTSNGVIHGLGDFDLSAAGEIAPSLAALLVFADAPTSLTGIGHLRGHETNRLEALVTEIRRVGGDADELADGIAIRPVGPERLHGAVMETYADHRMATFAAMLGLRIRDIDVVNVETTRKTIPDFVGLWSSMLG
ncbi:3-phosphoshikimate 1-carboxyvinyltransferase [Bifidobacterium sp. SMB2]|uniref:3-phosphoshikimate 1-carboxyvinyltransferase n=1 Tax=Bifidobacterium saimiriisciurei TaxID=2661627 RepID=A0ABX0C6F2_9BIFI|nr:MULTISPECIES: 3-phosphoshikimate 1-carboxyvinyltransferase [Bifidobacterium]NEG96153.1 3-phosphoshikimate 1-carboxyvinyltransferase [Bifidobacterium sp. SMB2]NEH10769.1 3-phosphoshikimate 1-carboxyvinyltransferase [Bifidobacterium saimiriisciurei]